MSTSLYRIGMHLTASRLSVGATLLFGLFLTSATAHTQAQQSLSPELQEVENVLGKMRQMPDAERAVASKNLALKIRKLPASADKVLRAVALANLSTEGDFGQSTLQEVTTTLEKAVIENPPARERGEPAFAYAELATLAHYEHMKVSLKVPDYLEALSKLNKTDELRAKADFTLKDITGHTWTLSSLKGKVVVVNFWATWCPPCRKEMPDLEILANRYKKKGLVVLAISNEKDEIVKAFIKKTKYTYPILLDPAGETNKAYSIDGIPKTYFYNRKGALVAQAIDMRTMDQFKKLLLRTGLK